MNLLAIDLILIQKIRFIIQLLGDFEMCVGIDFWTFVMCHIYKSNLFKYEKKTRFIVCACVFVYGLESVVKSSTWLCTT